MLLYSSVSVRISIPIFAALAVSNILQKIMTSKEIKAPSKVVVL
jgi:hypothetical protein